MTIRKLTTADVKAMARDAAEHHIPLREANDYCVGSAEWDAFNAAYREREAQMHVERVLEAA